MWSGIHTRALAFVLVCLAMATSCSKGDSESSQCFSIEASIPEYATRTDGGGTNVNRCILEIFYNESSVGRYTTEVSSGSAVFSGIRLVVNRTYDFAFWADCGDTDHGDLYYSTSSLKSIDMTGIYSGNNDARDAFFGYNTKTVTRDDVGFSISLHRPFAQINVITTDVQTAATASVIPTSVSVTIKNAFTRFNAASGVASVPADLTYSTSPYESLTGSSATSATLSMDYILAGSEKQTIDMTFGSSSTSNTNPSHTFTNVPYQQNYRTNITGKLLTTDEDNTQYTYSMSNSDIESYGSGGSL